MARKIKKVEIDLKIIDEKISSIIQEVDFYSLLTPSNWSDEKETFFSYLEEGKAYNPLFRYKESNFKDHTRWLEDVYKSLSPNNPLENIFARKIEFVSGQLDLLGSESEDFTKTSIRLFGRPDAECLAKAKEVLLESKKENYSFPEETVTPEEMASILREKLADSGIEWNVVISSKIVPKITVSGKDKIIYINSRIKYTEEEVERLKIHEVEVHIFRGANGSRQPYKIFAEGLAGYDETEEGLAIIAEEATGSLKIDTRQMKLYAGRALSVDYCLNGGFYEAFIALREFFPDYMAYRLIERTKRGIKDTSKKGAITKDFHYISGWISLNKYLKERGELSTLFVGKIGLKDVRAVKGLLKEKILQEPKYIPEFIRKD